MARSGPCTAKRTISCTLDEEHKYHENEAFGISWGASDDGTSEEKLAWENTRTLSAIQIVAEGRETPYQPKSAAFDAVVLLAEENRRLKEEIAQHLITAHYSDKKTSGQPPPATTLTESHLCSMLSCADEREKQ